MIDLLLWLLVAVIVVAFVVWLISMLPIDGRFKQIAQALIILIVLIVVLMKALPLLGVAV